MTYLEIESFLAITKYGNLSAAAEALFISQPALSRRMASLENELGFQLFLRQKGGRSIQLTKEGIAFLDIAKKWKHLWNETVSIASTHKSPLLKLSSVGSVSNYIFPEVFRSFLKKYPNYKLSFHHYHSLASYNYMENGLIDLAFVSDQRFSKGIRTLPAFSEPFVLVSGMEYPENKPIHPSMLTPENEIRLPWNDEYDAWHTRHFDESIYPYVTLNQMSLLDEFLTENTWAIVPMSVSHHLKTKGRHVYSLIDGPSDRIIYYLTPEEGTSEIMKHFLSELDMHLQTLDNVHSHLFSSLKNE